METVRFEGIYTGLLDHNRPYMPGITMHITCPGCGKEEVQGMGEDYLRQYMPVGEAFEHVVSCGTCGRQWAVTVLVSVTVKCEVVT